MMSIAAALIETMALKEQWTQGGKNAQHSSLRNQCFINVMLLVLLCLLHFTKILMLGEKGS